MSEELCFLSIAEAGRLIARKALSPVELTRAYLDRMEALDPTLNAYITRTAELALRQAGSAEAEIGNGDYRGPLHGIPFALKDMFETRGVLTTAHSRVLQDNVPARDATAVTRLYQAGGILLGKLATHEFAHGGPSFDLPWPPARNPWNPAHFTGGSSSGAGSAVAAGMAPMALGTDTGGSIRTPSWLCGTVGLKPTYGRVSRAGIIPFSETFDHAGPITWTVEDAAIALNALQGHDPLDAASARMPREDFSASINDGIRGMRIGFIRHFSEEDQSFSPELTTAVDEALQVFRALGAHVEDVRLRSLHDYYAVRIVITEMEIFSLHQENLRQRPGDYGRHFLARCLPACLFSGADYVGAQRERRRMIAGMQPFYERYDVLVSVGGGPAANLADHKSMGGMAKWLQPSMGALGSITGAPVIAQCCGLSKDGLPLGMQLHGRPWDEKTLLRIARAYEAATPWRNKRPAVKTGPQKSYTHEDGEFRLQDADPEVRDLAYAAAARAGLKLSDKHLALLVEAAPYVFTLAGRIPRDFSKDDEMAVVFSPSIADQQ